MKKAMAPMRNGSRKTNDDPAIGLPSLSNDVRIEESNDWRVDVLVRVRELIRQAEPEVVEEVKWRKPSNGMRGVPVWSRGGIVCTGEMYKDKVKLTFAKGASLADPAGLFNASLDGNVRRAIDLSEGDAIDEGAFQELVRGAVALNLAGRAGGGRKRAKGG